MLSKKTRYAILALTRLAREYGKGPVLIGEVAKGEGIPQRFLESILLELKKIGFVGSRAGKLGGYFLIKEPGEITLSDIMRATSGPIALVPCVSEKYYQPCDLCKDEKTCRLRSVFKEIRDESYRILSQTSLMDLVEES